MNMLMSKGEISALLVADAPGHILERIGHSWMRNSDAVHHEVVCSQGLHPFVILRRGAKLGLIHWINSLLYEVCASAVSVPQLVMVHHLTEQEINGMLARLSYCDGITTVSERWKVKLENLTHRHVFKIPNAIDVRIFSWPRSRGVLRSKAGISENEFVLGFVGKAAANAFGRKGIDVLLKVLEAAGNIWRDLCLVLVGPGWEYLTPQVEAMGIRVDRYEFATSEQTASAYGLMDTLLVTSREEGGPCTILEAMACGVPVVTSDVGHVPEVITNGKTGFICPSRTPQEYIEKITLLRSNPDLRRRIQKAARKFIERERDESVVIPRIDFSSLYRDAINHYHKRSTYEHVARPVWQSYFAARYVASSSLNALGLRRNRWNDTSTLGSNT